VVKTRCYEAERSLPAELRPAFLRRGFLARTAVKP
jgi:hypothetical protein